MTRWRAALTVMGALLAASPAAAQVSGSVVDDASGAPIGGALLTLRATATRAVAGADGSFSLGDVPAGDAVIVAAARGWYNGSISVTAPSSGAEIRLEAVPAEDDPAHVFAAPSSCGACHSAQLEEWRGSAMSHGGTNTWVHDIYDGSGTAGGEGGFVYLRDSVHAAANPASECASCHQPLTWIASPFSAMAPLEAATPEVEDGVSCVICHQIAGIDLSRPNAPGIFPGVVTMTRLRDPASTVMYGVLGDVDFRAPGQMRAAYNPQLTAEICASCHQDANDPDGDHDYDEEGSVISEPTYLEWLGSPYADPGSGRFATCVDCHMAPNEATLACSLPLGYSRAPGQLRTHRIEGTTDRFLENAVTLEVGARREGETIVVEATITNDLTGHHVPTGVTIRNMILLVEAESVATGQALPHTGSQVVDELGGVGDPAMGYYAGLPGVLYAKRNHDASGAGPTFFTDATGITEDNRIAPLASDTTSYTFDASGGGAVRVRARLLYRRSWRALLDAKGWTEDGHGEPAEDLAPPHFGHLMEEAEVVVPEASGPDAGRPPDAGPAPSGGSGCACRARPAGPSEGALVLSLIALGALLWRRRRPRPGPPRREETP